MPGHLQSQMSTILDKMSDTHQQLLDVQKSNEQLQKLMLICRISYPILNNS